MLTKRSGDVLLRIERLMENATRTIGASTPESSPQRQRGAADSSRAGTLAVSEAPAINIVRGR
jgi:hypothetical protein